MTYRHDPRDARSLAHDQVWALHTDHHGRRWIGTSGGLCTPAVRGFACYRPEGPGPPGGFTAIEGDADGALWLAIHGQGVARFDPDTRRFTASALTDSLEGAITLRRDRSGVLWVGTLNRGLWRLDGTRGDARAPDAARLVRRGSVFDIHEDAGGALWLGTDRGLARVSPDRSEVTWIPVPGGPSGTTVFAVAPDDAGRLWLGTGHGLARYDPLTGALRRYGGRDGVGVSEFNRKAWVRLRDGRLLFGGVDGLVAFAPAALDAEAVTAPVALTRLERTSAEGVVSEVLHGARDLVLTPRDYAFAVEFVAPGFTGPLHYRYRLDGFDPDWVAAGPERRATYTNLRPGRYTFRVQHAVGDGPWTEPGEVAAVVVRPPFWGTAWFRTLALALLAGLLYAVHRARVRRLLAVERMRLRIAGDLHDDIGANLSSIALLSDLVRSQADLPDAERRQLERISASARATLDDMRDIVWSIDPDLDHFADLVTKMQDTAAPLLPGIRCRFSLPEAGVPEKLSMACRRDVFLAFKEALHNVARHAHATEVEVLLAVNGDCLTLAVRDDGVGLNGNGHGKGLRSLRERAERLGGRCEVESAPGAGTTVRFEARMT